MKKTLSVRTKADDRLKARTLNINLTDRNIVKIAFIAAKYGLTHEQLVECFINDIITIHESTEITREESYLAKWFNGSWFSQDNDGYFSFLQYVISNGYYKKVISTLDSITYTKCKKNSNAEYKQLKEIFCEYCIKNSAHQSFNKEIKIILDFKNHINMMLHRKIANHVNAKKIILWLCHNI